MKTSSKFSADLSYKEWFSGFESPSADQELGWTLLSVSRIFYPAVSASFIAPFLIFLALNNSDGIIEESWIGINATSGSLLGISSTVAIVFSALFAIPLGAVIDVMYDRRLVLRQMIRFLFCLTVVAYLLFFGGMLWLAPILVFVTTLVVCSIEVVVNSILPELSSSIDERIKLSSLATAIQHFWSVLLFVICMLFLVYRPHRTNMIQGSSFEELQDLENWGGYSGFASGLDLKKEDFAPCKGNYFCNLEERDSVIYGKSPSGVVLQSLPSTDYYYYRTLGYTGNWDASNDGELYAYVWFKLSGLLPTSEF